jgi:hypothetical protein
MSSPAIKLVGFLSLLFTANGVTYAQTWRGIVPLHTARTAVEQKLGKPTMDRDDSVAYDFKTNEPLLILKRTLLC